VVRFTTRSITRFQKSRYGSSEGGRRAQATKVEYTHVRTHLQEARP